MGLRKKDRPEIKVPTSSLADIAFLLIIFFMVISMVNTSKGLRFNLPSKKTNPKTILRSKVLIIDLKKNNNLLVDNKIIKEANISDILSARKKKGHIEALLLRVQRDCQYGRFAQLVSKIRLSGFQKFSIKGID